MTSARLVLLIAASLPGVAAAWQTLVADTPPAARPSAVAVDPAGDVVAAGRTVGAGGEDGLLVGLAGTDGAERWQHVFAGSAGGDDLLRAVITAPGAVLAVGQVLETDTAGDALVTRHAPDGTEVWTVRVDGGARLEDDAFAVAVDPSGDVLVAGQSTPTGGGAARFTVTRHGSADGAVVWTTPLDDVAGTARALAVRGPDVLAAGEIAGALVVVRLAGASGAPAWLGGIAGSAGGAHVGRALAADDQRVVVAGRLVSPAGNPNFAVAAFDLASGTEVWRYVADGTLAGNQDADDAFGVAIDAAGDVVAVGRLSNTATDDDLLAVKLAGATGTVLWRRVVNGGSNNADVAQALALDAAGDVLIAGTLRSPGTRADLLVLTLRGATGAEVWRRTYDGSEHEADSGLAVAAGGGGVVAGGRLRNGDADGFAVVKLTAANGGDFPCADGTTDPGEACDDGDLAPGDGCRADCTAELCGDGIRDPQEACDGGPCCSASCGAAPDGTPCNDTNACTSDDACRAGACAAGTVVACPAESPCHTGVCSPVDGVCRSVPKLEGDVCDDADACTGPDRCVLGTCTGSAVLDCDDGETCTTDACDPALGCRNVARTGVESVICVLERDAIRSACPAGLPRAVQIRLDRARRFFDRAGHATAPKSVRRALKRGAGALRQTAGQLRAQIRRERIEPLCAAVLTAELGEVTTRADALRAAGTP